MVQVADPQTLDKIIDKTLDTVGKSREQIFEISEQSRNEYVSLEQELQEVRMKVAEIIDQSDRAEVHARFARNRLAEVSKQFHRYSNEEIRKVYEQANELQVKLALLQQEEQQLRDRRDAIERRLLNLKDTIERAEELVGQMTVVYNFLTGDLRQVGEALEDAREKQAFGLQIIQAQEEERRKLSREIHDGPAQMMANVLLRSELVERIYHDKGIDEALKEIRDLRKMVKSSLAEVRRIIYDLRPMALDDLGLIPTLKKYVKTFEEHTGIFVDFKHIGKGERFPEHVEIALFRLVQEALQNTRKHAKASHVHVKIEEQKTKFTVVIKDNGKGFDQTEKKEGSFGLVGMKERVNMLKGQLVIRTKPNDGTTIIISIPITTEE